MNDEDESTNMVDSFILCIVKSSDTVRDRDNDDNDEGTGNVDRPSIWRDI